MFKYSDRKSNWSLIGDSLAIPESGVIPAFPFKIVRGIDFTCCDLFFDVLTYPFPQDYWPYLMYASHCLLQDMR